LGAAMRIGKRRYTLLRSMHGRDMRVITIASPLWACMANQ
jgi:hypothetical protein